MHSIYDHYGELVFNSEKMQSTLAPHSFAKFQNSLDQKSALDNSLATEIANCVKQWAIENKATHFTHWFQPQRNGTAEKHDAFINYTNNGGVIETFSTNQLIQSEPDASSFPSGGIRSTFEARGYTAWDPTSPMFIRDEHNVRSLIIPSIYLSWTGEALDMKTPLHRSIKALNDHAIELQHLIGNKKANQITVYSGMEQEYFLIPKDVAKRRLDLTACGRTIFGAAPVKGQLMEDHYFGSINSKVSQFMSALDQELYRYGIPAKTKHNEVAPNQFELAPLYEEIGLAIDHNLLTMDIMRRIASDHGFVVLFHEKPFSGLNGSGKHMNWSIGDNTGENYLEPSHSPAQNISFLMTIGALLYGLQHYSGLLRAAISDAGNEHRMGSHEAPPAILSVYMGSYLNDILNSIQETTTITEKTIGTISHGIEILPAIMKDISDRNRTSPIAFTGNKFELRALGSSANGSDAARTMNLLCTYGYAELIKRLKPLTGDPKINVMTVLRDIFNETKLIRFEGNNYDPKWKDEAKKRNLFVVDTTPEALKYNLEDECVKLFEDFNVLTRRELESRIHIKYDAYTNTKIVEYNTAITIARREIMPAVLRHINDLVSAISYFNQHGDSKSLHIDLTLCETLYSQIQSKITKLQIFCETTESHEDAYSRAYLCATQGANLLQDLREDVDQAESLVAADYWPLPTYDKLLLEI